MSQPMVEPPSHAPQHWPLTSSLGFLQFVTPKKDTDRKYSLKFHKRVHTIFSIPIEWTHHCTHHCTLPLARRGGGRPDQPKDAQWQHHRHLTDPFTSERAAMAE